jgi:putative acetyltransferase
LHGLYVHPEEGGRGVGRALLHAAQAAATAAGMHGVLVKAQTDSVGFFERLGLEALPVEDAARHYARRFWLSA